MLEFEFLNRQYNIMLTCDGCARWWHKKLTDSKICIIMYNNSTILELWYFGQTNIIRNALQNIIFPPFFF